MKKCDNCGRPFEGVGHIPVNENFAPQKGIVFCKGCYGESLIKRTVILQQNDCAPDSLEFFEKAFEKKYGFSFWDFKKKAERISEEDGYFIKFILGDIEATISADSPFWVVSEIS